MIGLARMAVYLAWKRAYPDFRLDDDAIDRSMPLRVFENFPGTASYEYRAIIRRLERGEPA